MRYRYIVDGSNYELEMIFGRGTDGKPYDFGEDGKRQMINLDSFFMSKFQVTQALWKHKYR